MSASFSVSRQHEWRQIFSVSGAYHRVFAAPGIHVNILHVHVEKGIVVLLESVSSSTSDPILPR